MTPEEFLRIRNLASALRDEFRSNDVGIHLGEVLSDEGDGTLTLTIDGDAEDIQAGIRKTRATANVGDIVLIVRNGADWTVVGGLDDGTGAGAGGGGFPISEDSTVNTNTLLTDPGSLPDGLRVQSVSDANPADISRMDLQAGSGGAVAYFQVDTNGGNEALMAVAADDSGSGSASVQYRLGGTNILSLVQDGVNKKIGFFGVTEVTRPAHPTTLADVITLLTNLGLCS